MHCIEKSTWDIIGTFFRPPQSFRSPRSHSPPGDLCTPCPPSLRPWMDTTLKVDNNGALISSDFKPFKIAERRLFSLDLVGLPTINHKNFVAICTEMTYNCALGTVSSRQQCCNISCFAARFSRFFTSLVGNFSI